MQIQKRLGLGDSIRLIEYAFANYEYINIKEKIESEFESWKANKNIQVIKGKTKICDIILDEIKYEYMPVNKSNIKDVTIHVECADKLIAPIQKGQKIGVLQVKIGDKIAEQIDILAKEEIQKKNIYNYMIQLLFNYNAYLQMHT